VESRPPSRRTPEDVPVPKRNPAPEAAPRVAVPLLVLAASLACGAVHAADPPAAGASASAIDPKALDALKTMGEHMRRMKSFEVHADTTIDEVDDDGQKLQFTGTVDFKVRRPNGLRAEIDSDRQQRTFYYDGKTLTQYAPRMGYYASVSAPPTLRELADVLQNKYGLSLPLTDLFRWGEDQDDGSSLTAAAFIGPSKIGGTECGHFAYRQPDVDWQVWIARESKLPCKLVITTLDEPAQPQYAAVFMWKPNVALDEKTFTFEQPKSAHRIEIAVVDSSGH
jgi:hypothetical protein